MHGLTLTELLVTLAIIGILLAISLPAVQYAREAARKAQCRAHLQQMALAVGQYETTHRMLPPGLSRLGSLHVALLPFVGETALFDRIVSTSQSPASSDPNWLTGLAAPIPVYLCPSDNAPPIPTKFRDGIAGTNYAGNSGNWPILTGYNGPFRPLHDVTSYGHGPVRLADMSDGTSNTACLADILRSNRTFERLRVNWMTPKRFDHPNERDAFAAMCRSVPENAFARGWRGNEDARGTPWTEGNMGYTIYDHVLPPQNPSCYNGFDVPTAISTAASNHPGGVHVAFLDSHVAFVSQTIDQTVWRELGSGRDVAF